MSKCKDILKLMGEVDIIDKCWTYGFKLYTNFTVRIIEYYRYITSINRKYLIGVEDLP